MLLTTLGIDLASQDDKTAFCRLRWSGERSVAVERIQTGAGDDELLAEMAAADAIGIDAPFGWPVPTTGAITEWSETGEWPIDEDLGSSTNWRERLRLRVTDSAVHDYLLHERQVSLWPLSVAADSIAVPAWRAARLLTQHHRNINRRLDRTGLGTSVYEVYPAAALCSWGFPHRGYKSGTGLSAEDARQRREEMLEQMEAEAQWLAGAVTGDARHELIRTDHAFDAFVSATVACAADAKAAVPPPADHEAEVAVEGWIHVPYPDSFAELAP